MGTKGSKSTAKVTQRNKVKQMYVFLITLPSGRKYVDSTTNRTPKDKLYWHFGKIRDGKESPFYEAVRNELGGRTDGLEIRILEYGQSNEDHLAKMWLEAKMDEWIARLETDSEEKGGLNTV